jgi:integrase
MARQVIDARLMSREARGKLAPRGKPYWRLIEDGLHLGYRRLKGGRAGTWCLRSYLGDKRHAVEGIGSADDYSDANGITILNFAQAQTRARRAVEHKAHTSKDAPLTVDRVMEEYLGWLDEHGKSGVDSRARYIAFIKQPLGTCLVNSLTTKQLRDWHASLTKKPPRLRTAAGKAQKYRDPDHSEDAKRRRKASANRTLTVLRAALNMAWREHRKLVPSGDEWRAVKPFKNVDAFRSRYLTVAEAQRLINATSGDFRTLVQTALATGCRYGELCNMRVKHFNEDVGVLTIPVAKAGKSRDVILNPEAQKLFAALCAGRDGDELILGKQWRKSEQARPMKEACKAARLKPISFHGLRHSWASIATMNGVPLLVVAKNLGHSDTRMVEKHYGHLAPSYMVDAIRAGAPVFGLKPSNVRSLRHG